MTVTRQHAEKLRRAAKEVLDMMMNENEVGPAQTVKEANSRSGTKSSDDTGLLLAGRISI